MKIRVEHGSQQTWTRGMYDIRRGHSLTVKIDIKYGSEEMYQRWDIRKNYSLAGKIKIEEHTNE